MQFKKIHFIVSAGSGKEEPILSFIDKALKKTKIKWEVTVSQGENDAFDAASLVVGHADLVVVYGGDGTVSEVAKALKGTSTPMAIVPGGTANVLSKTLGIPQDSEKALAMIAGGHTRLMKMDVGEANGTPFLLRINFGIMAEMVLEADHKLKKNLGQLAYGVTVVKTITAAKPEKYRLIVDGKVFEEEGVALTITNAGHIGIGELSLLPGIRVDDGYLDVILMKDTDLLSMLKVAGTTLFQAGSDVLKHWRCKEVTVSTHKPVAYICDDREEKGDKIDIRMMPLALKVLVPADV